MKKAYTVKNDTRLNAHGRWRGILKHFGFTDKELSGVHGPCPLCEGTDRFRFTDYKGNGDYFCSMCGPGGGFDLVMGKLDLDFAHAAHEVDKVMGTEIEQVFQPRVDIEKRRRDMNFLWAHATDWSVVSQYLDTRGITIRQDAFRDLRGHPQMFMVDSNERHRAMLALIRNPKGEPVSIHRTYVDLGLRKVMPPIETIKGCAIRLGHTSPDHTLIIGEGVETVLSGMEEFGGAGYACINAGNMEEVILPDSIQKVIILADNDTSFTGQKSAFILARKLDTKKKTVEVIMRATAGLDFNDAEDDALAPLSWRNAK